MEGWYLRAENGAHFVVTDDGEPFRISDHTKNGDLFDGLTSGERVRITHDDIAETDPCQTGAYSCELLEERTPEGTAAVTFDAEKWRSGLGAYFFCDCTSIQTAGGHWDGYTVGSEAIS